MQRSIAFGTPRFLDSEEFCSHARMSAGQRAPDNKVLPKMLRLQRYSPREQ
jgi:hypothetical protein